MEAELNSPMVRLEPGESYNFDTDWFPTRADAGFQGVTDAGVILKPLRAAQDAGGKIKLYGSFGVFLAGKLVAHFYDAHGTPIGSQVFRRSIRETRSCCRSRWPIRAGAGEFPCFG